MKIFTKILLTVWGLSALVYAVYHNLVLMTPVFKHRTNLKVEMYDPETLLSHYVLGDWAFMFLIPFVLLIVLFTCTPLNKYARRML